MPIYEYRCGECGHQDRAPAEGVRAAAHQVPGLRQARPTRSMLSAAGFQLKGSGWYATDFKSSGKKPAEKKADAEDRRQGRGQDRSQDRNQVRNRKPRPSPRPRPTTTRLRPGCNPTGPARAGPFHFRTMKKYFITGLLIWIPLVITIWVLKLVVDVLDQSLLLLPVALADRELARRPHPGPGRHPHAADRARHRRLRHQLLRRAAGRAVARHPAPHPGGELDLLEREADLRHAVLLERPGVPQGAAGAVAARRACGPSPSSPARRAASVAEHLPPDCVASTCRPRPTRPAATSSSCRART